MGRQMFLRLGSRRKASHFEPAGAAGEAGAPDPAAGAALPDAAELSAGGGAPAGGPPAWRNVTVSSMSCIRSFVFFTAPSYSVLPDALSRKAWKVCFACWYTATALSVLPAPLALYSCVRM